MSSGIFYRNTHSRNQLELLLLAAASSVLLVRFYLHITGYPQIGGDSLHIAHMLWGGALMLAALVITLSFLGARARRVAAITGGIGFGVFIDELGKFITHDNNYFYKPTIGLIYAIFIGLYLAFNFLSRRTVLTNREYQLNALSQLEEAIVQDMNPTEKAEAQELLAHADQNDPLTKRLQQTLASVETIPPAPPTRYGRFITWIDGLYEKFLHYSNSNLLIRIFFVAEALLFIAAVLLTVYTNVGGTLDTLKQTESTSNLLVIGQFIASLISACFAAWGAIVLPRSRLLAYEQFRRATLVTIFLTQFFMFTRMEFGALPGFFFNLALLGLISYAIRQEQRLTATPHHPKFIK
jgi:hypothetical protein